jgi:hypothetical protein
MGHTSAERLIGCLSAPMMSASVSITDLHTADCSTVPFREAELEIIGANEDIFCTSRVESKQNLLTFK